MTDTDARLEPPQLVDYKISPDDYSDSPRTWDNLGEMLSTNHTSAWDSAHFWDGEIEAIWMDVFIEHGWPHMVDRIIEDTGATVVLPLVSNQDGVFVFNDIVDAPTHIDGVIFDTQESRELMGVTDDALRVRKYLHGEIEALTEWVRGDVYQYSIVDHNGDIVGGCGGFYGLDYCEQEAVDEAMHINKKRIAEWKRQLDHFDEAPDTKTMPAQNLLGHVKIEMDGIVYELTEIHTSPAGHPVAELKKVKQ